MILQEKKLSKYIKILILKNLMIMKVSRILNRKTFINQVNAITVESEGVMYKTIKYSIPMIILCNNLFIDKMIK